MTDPAAAAVRLLKTRGLAPVKELESRGLSRRRISQLARDGRISRVARGLYALPGTALPGRYTLVAASRRAPRGVVCLLSALEFHELTTQLPREVWLAIGEKDRRPAGGDVRIRTVRFSPSALRAGVETHRIGGLPVRIFNPAKTVADCFKYRNKIGLDIALEALREYLRQRKGTVDDLAKYAKVDRVSAVMRPYLEALA